MEYFLQFPISSSLSVSIFLFGLDFFQLIILLLLSFFLLLSLSLSLSLSFLDHLNFSLVPHIFVTVFFLPISFLFQISISIFIILITIFKGQNLSGVHCLILISETEYSP